MRREQEFFFYETLPTADENTLIFRLQVLKHAEVAMLRFVKDAMEIKDGVYFVGKEGKYNTYEFETTRENFNGFERALEDAGLLHVA